MFYLLLPYKVDRVFAGLFRKDDCTAHETSDRREENEKRTRTRKRKRKRKGRGKGKKGGGRLKDAAKSNVGYVSLLERAGIRFECNITPFECVVCNSSDAAKRGIP